MASKACAAPKKKGKFGNGPRAALQNIHPPAIAAAEAEKSIEMEVT